MSRLSTQQKTVTKEAISLKWSKTRITDSNKRQRHKGLKKQLQDAHDPWCVHIETKGAAKSTVSVYPSSPLFERRSPSLLVALQLPGLHREALTGTGSLAITVFLIAVAAAEAMLMLVSQLAIFCGWKQYIVAGKLFVCWSYFNVCWSHILQCVCVIESGMGAEKRLPARVMRHKRLK